MPRSMIRDPAARIRKMMTGTPTRPIRLTEVARRTGIPQSTLYHYRQSPEHLPLMAAILIADSTGMTDEEWLALRKA